MKLKRYQAKILSLLMVICMLFSNAATLTVIAADYVRTAPEKEDVSEEPFASVKNYDPNAIGAAKVDETTLLVLVDAERSADIVKIPAELADLGVVAARTLIDISSPEDMAEAGYKTPVKWMLLAFDEKHKATEVAPLFEKIDYIRDAEYNFESETAAVPEVEDHPMMEKEYYLNSDIKKAWDYLDEKGYMENLSNVVVAVIDTGVDYTHPDLANSMWVNANEIPGNGVDDDGNGYVDDVYGVSTVGNIFDSNGDPMDDNGHGTHVAGIIAANGEMAGVACGAKIMAIKAGQASGIFHDSDIIEAINYAVMMGADVINMSFGGYGRSAMVEDALAMAYSKAVLVAAAGNEGADLNMAGPVYPAAYNFVLGVMALDTSGSMTASYSNTDAVRRNSKEYEVAALGTSMYSTLPNGEYATWSGTSMATPYVSAIAALLRSKLDKETYSTRYIMSQIAGTASPARMGLYGVFDIAVSAYDALTKAPEPDLSFFDYYIFDDKSLSDKNNGNGIADAGETIGLGVYIRNHWGEAREVTVTLDSISAGGVANPYIEWITDEVVYGDIGSFVTANNGILFDEESVANGISTPFVLKLADNTPNSSALNFNVNMRCCTYDADGNRKDFFFDETTSGGVYQNSFLIYSRKGIELPRRIDYDMTLTADNYYIISGSTLIDTDATVTIEPGTQLQFWGDYSKELYASQDVANLHVDGTLIIRGTEDNPVNIFPADNLSHLGVYIQPRVGGKIDISYAHIANPCVEATTIDHCYFYQNNFEFMGNLYRSMDGQWHDSPVSPYVRAKTITNSKFFEMGFQYMGYDYRLNVSGKVDGNLFDSCGLHFSISSWDTSTYTNNVFLRNNRLVDSQYGDRSYLISQIDLSSDSSVDIDIYSPVKNPTNGSTYFAIETGSYTLAERVAQSLGGHVVKADNYDELEFLKEYIDRYYGDKSEYYANAGRYRFDYFGIGFNAISEYNFEYLGEFKEEGWLDAATSLNYPAMSPYYNDISTWSYEANRFNEDGMLGDFGSQFAIIIELPGEPTLTGISIDAGESLKLHTQSAPYQLTYTKMPANVQADCQWTSSNESVVVVDANGLLSVVGVGESVVTVTDASTGVTDSITVTVAEYIKPESLVAETDSVTITVYNGTHTLAPVISPADATVSPIVWSSNNSGVATVSATGVVTALSSGQATITGTIADEGLTISYTVNVVIPVESVQLSFNYTTLYLGTENHKQIEVSRLPTYAVAISPEFISHDKSIVTVDDKGVLTPVGTGITVVEVRTSANSVYCVVNVLANAADTTIQSVSGDLNNYSAFLTADGTAWMLSNSSASDGSINLIPQKLPIKAKSIQRVNWGGGWLYIDMEDNLLYSRDLTFNNAVLIDSQVAVMEQISNAYTYEFYYAKTDGTVWFIENLSANDKTPEQVHYMSAVTDITFNNYNTEHHMFIDSAGALWYIEDGGNIKKPTSFVKIDTPVKMASFPNSGMMNEGLIFAENGDMYRWYDPSQAICKVDLSYYYNYNEYASRIVKYAPYYDNSGIALLDDGTAVYYGGKDYLRSSGLIDCVEEMPASYSVFVPLTGISGIVDIGVDCFILEDGNVMTFHWSNADKPLGNNTTAEVARKTSAPVYAWFGVTGVTNERLVVTDVQYTTEDGLLSCRPDQMITGVNSNSEIVITLNRAATEYYLEHISLTDEFGNKVAADVKISYLYITITPKEALTAGIEYTIDIPESILLDFFGNENELSRITFAAAGKATYPVPVTGISDENTLVELGYNGQKQLTPVITPENAYKKTVIWTVLDERVATIDSYGVVTAVDNGTTTITGRTLDGDFTVTYTVHVRIEIENVVPNEKYLMLNLTDKTTATLLPKMTPANAKVDVMTYISSDETVATVDANGVITARGVGKTVVTLQVNNILLSCLVHVMEDMSAVTIDRVYSDNDYTVYYTADGTTWIVDDWQNQREVTPIRLPVKTKYLSVAYNNNGYVYIDMDDNLCYIDKSFTNQQIIDTDVKLVENTRRHSYGFFYIKNDDTICYKSDLFSDIVVVEYLANIVDIMYTGYANGYHMFLDRDGHIWSFKKNEDVTVPTNFHMYVHDATFVRFDGGHYVLDDQARAYNIEGFTENNTPGSTYLVNYFGYELYKDRIVKYAYSSLQDGLALLDDGTVVYFGYLHTLTGGSYSLDGYYHLPENILYSDAFVELLFENVKDIALGNIIFEDGSVLAFKASTGDKILGDGTPASQTGTITAPVIPLFGIQVAKETLELTEYEASIGDGTDTFAPDELAENVLKDSTLRLFFGTTITSAKTQYVTMSDEFGNKVAIEVSVVGKTLLIKPVEPLKDGIQYTVTLPNDIMTNYFGNSNTRAYFSFVVAGVATYPVPVTGITDENTDIHLSNNGTAQLAPVISPENAYKKTVVWTSADASVASVDQNGLVTAVNNGTTTITARTLDGNFTVEYTVTVRFEIENVTLNSTYFMLDVKNKPTATVIPVISPDNAVIDSIIFESTDPAVATVDDKGVITAVGEGTVVIQIKINNTIQRCLVHVFADQTSLEIVSVFSDNDETVYYAADGTTWIVNDAFDSTNDITPIKLPAKTKYATSFYGEQGYLYIDTEDNLCLVNRAFTVTHVIDTNVKLIQSEYKHNTPLFYVKNDGTVWYRSNLYAEAIQIDYLSGITAIQQYYYNNNNYYIFLDSEGALWSIKSIDSVNEAFNYVRHVVDGVKLTAFVCDSYVSDDSGKLYWLNQIMAEGELSPTDYSDYLHYDEYRDTIVKWAYLSTNVGLALLQDGGVVYFGSTQYLLEGYNYGYQYALRGCYTLTNEEMYCLAFIKLSFENVADIAYDSIVFKDGSVLAIRTNSGKILGDGTRSTHLSDVKAPVVPLFGVNLSEEVLEFSGYEVSVGGNPARFDADKLAWEVDKNTTIKFFFNAAIVNAKTEFIALTDEFGNKVSIAVTYNGKELVITPAEPLKDGIRYTATIQNSILTNYFGNSNQKATLSFVVTGTATYPVPVTGITDENTDIHLGDNGTAALTPVIAPADAYQKTILWTTRDERVATVDENGLVTAVSNGTTTIIATTVDGKYTVEYTVTVRIEVETVTLHSNYLILNLADKQTATILPVITPDDAQVDSVTYVSTDPSVAVVDADGVVTAKSEGTAVLQIKVNDKTVSCLVHVFADSTSVEMVSVRSDSYETVYHAADGTTWIVDDFFNNLEDISPRMLPIKTKFLTTQRNYSMYLCIDMEDNLCLLDRNMRVVHQIDTNVKFIADDAHYRTNFFYVKTDGTVCYLPGLYNTPKVISFLSGITDVSHVSYNKDYGVFVDSDGALWCVPTGESVTEAVNYRILRMDGVVFTEIQNGYVLDTEGNCYEISDFLAGRDSIRTYDHSDYVNYEQYKDHIVRYVLHDGYQGLALLDDGGVVYFGYTNVLLNNEYGLSGCFAAEDIQYGYRAFVKLSFENVADIALDTVVMKDGTVQAFRVFSGKILGDGTRNNQVSSLTSPVTPLFGIDIAKEVLTAEAYEVSVGGTAQQHPLDAYVEGVDQSGVIKLIFNGAITDIRTQYIMMADEFGNKVSIDVTVDGKTVIVKPLEALTDGLMYTVTLPNGIMTNYFRNSNLAASVSFVAAGEAVYEIPAEGVTCDVSSLTMSKDEEKKLTAVVSPENATQKRLIWTSSNPAVATVNGNGVVTAHEDGTATVTATTVDGGHAATVNVTVFTTLISTHVNVAVGSEMNTQLIYKQGSTEEHITWLSADPAIVTVDTNGKLTPVSEGITAVYVLANGEAVMNYIISVVPSEAYLKINAIYTNSARQFTYVTDAGVWVLTSNSNTYPKFIAMTDVAEAVVSNEELLVRLKDNSVKVININDGTEYASSVKENVVQLAYRDSYWWALTEDGNLHRYVHNGSSGAWAAYEYFELGAKQIVINNNYDSNGSNIFILDVTGDVWYTNAYGNSIPEPYETDVDIVDLTFCDGMYMKDADGKLHRLYGTNKEDNENQSDVLAERGFYDINLDVVDYAGYYAGQYGSFLMLLADGGLAYFGEYADLYLRDTFGDIATIEADENNGWLYYIKGLPTVQEIGPGYILLENGNVVMCVRYGNLGNGESNYTDRPKTAMPRLTTVETPTTLEALAVVINGTETAFGGESLISVNTDVTGEIRLNFSNPLILSDHIRLISLKDSAGNVVHKTVRVEGKSIVITPDEALKTGETYQLVITKSSVKDIFTHDIERHEVSIHVAGSAAAGVTVYDQSFYPSTDYSPDYSKSELAKEINTILREIISEYASNNSGNIYNAFLNTLAFPDTTNWMNMNASSGYQYFVPFANNYWGTTNTALIDKMIFDVNDDFERAEVIYTPYLTIDQTETMYPFVTSVLVFNAEGDRVSQVGIEPITVQVTFNRDMNTGVNPYVGFGGDYPYGDFQLEGAWVDARTWVGHFNVTAVTGSGTQYFKVRNAVAAEDGWLTTGNDYERFTFTISTYGAKSMTLNAVGADGKVDLDWTQDDFDTLMGYNIYRSEFRDAALENYQKLNNTVIANSKSTFVDASVEQGKTYYYYFTVVQTDFSESDPSSVVEATVFDTSAPTIEHTPIREAAVGGNIAIIARVYDNITVRTVTLFYKDQNGNYVAGEMLLNRDEYNNISYVAGIPGSAALASGVQYYIEANDGWNTASMGTADAPLTISTYVAHQITVNTIGNGAVSLSKTMAKEGEWVYVTLNPYDGYRLVPGSLSYTDQDGTTHAVNGNAFLMPAGDITITATFTEASLYRTGDVTRDGLVDSADAVLILRYDAGLITLDTEQTLLADITGDGSVDVADAAQILQIDAGR